MNDDLPFETETSIISTIDKFKNYLQKNLYDSEKIAEMQRMVNLIRSNNEIDSMYNSDLRSMNKQKQNLLQEKHRQLIIRKNEIQTTLNSIASDQLDIETEYNQDDLQITIQNYQNELEKTKTLTQFYSIIYQILQNLNEQYKIISEHIGQLSFDKKQYHDRKIQAEKILSLPIPTYLEYSSNLTNENDCGVLEIEDIDYLKNDIRRSLISLESLIKDNEKRRSHVSQRIRSIQISKKTNDAKQKLKYYLINHDDPSAFQNLYALKSNRSNGRDKINQIYRDLNDYQKQIQNDKEFVQNSLNKKLDKIKRMNKKYSICEKYLISISSLETKVKSLRETFLHEQTEKNKLVRALEVQEKNRESILLQKHENESLVYMIKSKEAEIEMKERALIQKSKLVERLVNEIHQAEAATFKQEYIVEGLENQVVELEKQKKS